MSGAEVAFARSAAPTAPPPLALYIHLPWCVSKCPYCDFNSHQRPADLPETAYLDAVFRDLEAALPAVWGRRPQAVFIGGGTPSLFSPAAIDRLLGRLRALFNLSAETEITLEANPDSADAGKFAEFAASGVNRLSLGAQSFDDDSLRALGRAHDGAAAARAADAAARNFNNVNIDLMHALPRQTAAAAVDDVRRALAFAPAHLSLYQLTLERGTPFFRFPPADLPDDDAAAAIGDAVADAATASGYGRYEVSAYARPGWECRHNLNYWRFGDYLGVGAGAHGKITANGGIFRERRIKNPGDYMRRPPPPVAERWQVGGKDAVFEFFLNAFRLVGGFPLALARERIGALPASALRILDDAEKDGLVWRDAETAQATDKGLRYLNELLQRFL